MLRADALAASGAPDGMVVVSDFQSAGRGTRGRAWLAPPGSCLMFTVVCRPQIAPATLETLPRRVSETLAAALRADLGLACAVKAPNDVVVGARKLCGVLCTSRLVGERVAWVLVGIGLNTTMRIDELPLPTATSLAIEGVAVPSHGALLESLLRRLEWLREVDPSPGLPPARGEK